jgi:hypothetical protein
MLTSSPNMPLMKAHCEVMKGVVGRPFSIFPSSRLSSNATVSIKDERQRMSMTCQLLLHGPHARFCCQTGYRQHITEAQASNVCFMATLI